MSNLMKIRSVKAEVVRFGANKQRDTTKLMVVLRDCAKAREKWWKAQ
jgi:hypothetical protein